MTRTIIHDAPVEGESRTTSRRSVLLGTAALAVGTATNTAAIVAAKAAEPDPILGAIENHRGKIAARQSIWNQLREMEERHPELENLPKIEAGHLILLGGKTEQRYHYGHESIDQSMDQWASLWRGNSSELDKIEAKRAGMHRRLAIEEKKYAMHLRAIGYDDLQQSGKVTFDAELEAREVLYRTAPATPSGMLAFIRYARLAFDDNGPMSRSRTTDANDAPAARVLDSVEAWLRHLDTRPAAAQSLEADPILEAIERHRKAWRGLDAAAIARGDLEEELPADKRRWKYNIPMSLPPSDCTDDPRWIEASIEEARACTRESEAQDALLDTKPTTIAGAIALLEHAAEYERKGDGLAWPEEWYMLMTTMLAGALRNMTSADIA